MELLFERFLSEERGEWPDIDIDLPSGDHRERVIQYVYQRYGERGAPAAPLEETLVDYCASGVTVGPHLITHLRAHLTARSVLCARALEDTPNGTWVNVQDW